MGSHGYRRLWQWKSVFVDAPIGLGIYGNIWAKELGQEVHEGPQGWGRALPHGRALHPRGRLAASPTSSPSLLVCFSSKKDHHESFIPFGLHLVFLFCETQKQGKIGTVTGLVPKKI